MGNKNPKSNEKTNVMRLLDEKGVQYEALSPGEILNAVGLAEAMGVNSACVFKTLVTVAKSGAHYVFMLPANGELDLKKAAAVTGEKSVDMLEQKYLLPLTGYIHGGCSPIGMKKQFPTFIDESALSFEKIYFSAGKVGKQVKMNVYDLINNYPVIPAKLSK